MKPQENRSLIKNFFDQVLNGSAPFYLDGLISTHYIEHSPYPEQGEGREGVRQRLAQMHDAFSDLQFHLDSMIAEEDQVLARWHMVGQHTGVFFGIPASQQKVHCTGMDVYRIKDRKIIEHWHEMDLYGLYRQMTSFDPIQKAG